MKKGLVLEGGGTRGIYTAGVLDVFLENNIEYLDGGCADSVPIEAFQKMGYEKNVIILTRPAGYRKEASNAILPSVVYRK